MSSSAAKHRAVTAVVGGFVADAASMGLHWIYDAVKLSSLIAAAPDAAFHEPPSCPFYEYTSGAFSPYGDEVYPLLSHVASHGAFHAAEYSRASYDAAKSYTGRLNGVFKQVVAKGDAGETDLATENNDLHGAIKVPVLVAIAVRDGLSPAQLAAVVTQATRVHQIGEPPAGAAIAVAVLLHHIVQSSTPISTADAVRALATNELVPEATRALVREVVADVDAQTYADATTAINTYGKSCPLPGSLKGALFVLLTTNSYEDAVRVNIAAGGDNCSRSIVVGACAAAAGGDNAVPVAWQSKTTKYAELTAFAQKLVA